MAKPVGLISLGMADGHKVYRNKEGWLFQRNFPELHPLSAMGYEDNKFEYFHQDKSEYNGIADKTNKTKKTGHYVKYDNLGGRTFHQKSYDLLPAGAEVSFIQPGIQVRPPAAPNPPPADPPKPPAASNPPPADPPKPPATPPKPPAIPKAPPSVVKAAASTAQNSVTTWGPKNTVGLSAEIIDGVKTGHYRTDTGALFERAQSAFTNTYIPKGRGEALTKVRGGRVAAAISLGVGAMMVLGTGV